MAYWVQQSCSSPRACWYEGLMTEIPREDFSYLDQFMESQGLFVTLDGNSYGPFQSYIQCDETMMDVEITAVYEGETVPYVQIGLTSENPILLSDDEGEECEDLSAIVLADDELWPGGEIRSM